MADRGNVIAELTADHREVERLFERVLAMPPGDPMRKEVADRITIELVRHATAEEMCLYPAVREFVEGGDEVADRELLEQTEIERTLKRLEHLPVPNTEFNRLLAQLDRDVRTHIETEERVLFPQVADACSPQELEELGTEVRRAKDRAPTRPHPAAPHTPPANLRLAPGIGLVDRVRDAISGRGR